MSFCKIPFRRYMVAQCFLFTVAFILFMNGAPQHLRAQEPEPVLGCPLNEFEILGQRWSAVGATNGVVADMPPGPEADLSEIGSTITAAAAMPRAFENSVLLIIIDDFTTPGPDVELEDGSTQTSPAHGVLVRSVAESVIAEISAPIAIAQIDYVAEGLTDSVAMESAIDDAINAAEGEWSAVVVNMSFILVGCTESINIPTFFEFEYDHNDFINDYREGVYDSLADYAVSVSGADPTLADDPAFLNALICALPASTITFQLPDQINDTPILGIAAAGNCAANEYFPGTLSNVLAISATDPIDNDGNGLGDSKSDVPAPFSSPGEVFALGAWYGFNNAVGVPYYFAGTSFAAPLVSAMVASIASDCGVDQLIFLEMADNLHPPLSYWDAAASFSLCASAME